MTVRSVRRWIAFGGVLTGIPLSACTPSHTGRGASAGALSAPVTAPTRTPQAAPVILISIDGFRTDYLDSVPTPALHALAHEGVRGDGMRPAFPSWTFPNHYTLVTGWYPEDHHIVDNSIYDSAAHETLTMSSAAHASWWHWRGEPIWVTAARHGLKTATMFWPASEAVIDGYRPTYWRAYNESLPDTARVSQILRWLDLPSKQRPAFMTLYFSAVDHAGHRHGPWSVETRRAVIHIDSMIGALVLGLKRRHLDHEVNIIVVADHGMTAVNRTRTVALSDVLDVNTVITSEEKGSYLWVQPTGGDQTQTLAALRRLPHVRVYSRGAIPPALHAREDPGHFPILLLADDGWSIFKSRSVLSSSLSHIAASAFEMGQHGYDPAYRSMQALFLADGPSFRSGTHLPLFDNVDVYPLLAYLLRIPPAPNAGTLDVFTSVLSAERHAAVRTSRLSPPRLIVVVTVDQMRPDYLTRFGDALTGGLARLVQHGAVFTNAVQDHAITETAPGHASILSGRFPVHTGIASNSQGVGDSAVRLVGAAGLAASPWRFHGTTFADWLVHADAGSRVLSISRKDRAAILPIGKRKTGVYWFAPTGAWTTSTYYADRLPSWLARFNARTLAASYVGTTWRPLSDTLGSFMHPMPTDSMDAAEKLPNFPWMDQLTLEAALAGVRALHLGTREHTDLLTISLSTTDAVGHAYGPDSPEMRDQIVRLDRFLGAFLDTLYTLCDSTKVTVVLTADHGVGPIPGTPSADPNSEGRYVNVAPLEERVRIGLRRAGAPASAVHIANVVTVNRAALATAHVNADSLIAVIQDSLRATPGIARAERVSELQHEDTVHDIIARRWLHMFDSDSEAALVVTLQPYCYWGLGPSGGDHGTPYDYDARVPLIFSGIWFIPGYYPAPARVVDIAPTLAVVAHLSPTQRLDGHPLTEALTP